MSYILDALKRAERERRQGQGQVSVLDEIPSTPVAAPRRRLPRLLIPAMAGIIVVAVLAYALLAWRHRGANGAAARSTMAAAAPAAVQPQPVPAPPPVAAAMPAPGPPVATIEDANRLATLDDMQAPLAAAPAAAQQGNDVAAPPRPTAPASRPPPTSQGGERASPDDRAAAAPENPPPAAPAGDSAAQEVSPPPTPAQRQLREMPESFRANFPNLAVDVHAYNQDPARRFVLIGGKRYHEGDTLAEGPRITAIVPEGIVFDWQGQQVLYAIGH